jgi:hypothetical protein
MTYDDWKLETPEDEAYRKSGRGPRRGVYSVTVTRTLTAEITLEVEAWSEEDAKFDGVLLASKTLLNDWDTWTIHQDDYEVESIEGPPERDPDDERDERMDRERD